MATEAAISLAALLGGHARGAGVGMMPDAPPLGGPASDRPASDGPVPAEAVRDIIEAGRRLDQRGWVPASAGNISVRLDDGRIAITRSGCHKGFLEPEDVMLVEVDGTPASPGRPSAETLLHCQIYRARADVGAVLHGHSVAATVVSMHLPGAIPLAGYEVQKAFEGQRSHATRIAVPVFDNDQDIGRLAASVAPLLAAGMPAGYVIRGHGVYAWGGDMPTALVRLEALEFLLACELERMRLR